MGLPAHLILALLCLQACSSVFIQRCKPNNTLKEIIRTLNTLLEQKDQEQPGQCMELLIADVLAAPENTTEGETFCRVAMALRQLYTHHNCKVRDSLNKLDRNLNSMANKSCPMNEVGKSTLKDFLGRLRSMMQEKYSRDCS